MKRVYITTIGSILVLGLAGLLWANGVIPMDMGSAKEIVSARKALMVAIKLNMDDVKQKADKDDLGDIQANAAALDVMARVMPPLYRQKHEDVYTGKGKYYKGAPPAEFELICENLQFAAKGLFDSASKKDKAGVKTGIGKVYQTCGVCHKAYRGDF